MLNAPHLDCFAPFEQCSPAGNHSFQISFEDMLAEIEL